MPIVIDAHAPHVQVLIREQADVAIARLRARQLARREGMAEPATEALATAVSEIAQNIATHAGTGELAIAIVDEGERHGLMVVARDAGPGIADAEKAMEDGYSTVGTLGLGLASARRLTDEFELRTRPGQGTTVIMKKWMRRR